MTKPTRTTVAEHEGKKYLHSIHSAITEESIQIDVYAVLKAFNVVCPARAHAIKKLLCCGNRGKGTEKQDLEGALAAINRAIDLQEEEEF